MKFDKNVNLKIESKNLKICDKKRIKLNIKHYVHLPKVWKYTKIVNA